MRKIILAVVLVLLFITPALAGSVIINGTSYETDVIMENDHVFVPLRFVAEKLGFGVDWNGASAIINTTKRPEITGNNEAHVATVNQALDLLKKKDPVDYDIVCRYTKEIIISDSSLNNNNSEMYAFAMGGEKFYLSPELFTRSTEFVAGCLVHESTHFRTNDFITLKESENIAYLHELTAMKIIGASQSDLDYIEKSLAWMLENSK